MSQAKRDPVFANAKVFIAGARGMVGSAIARRLRAEGASDLLLPTRDELDLCKQQAVDSFFRKEKPEFVFLAAAKVGGIHANNAYPADFIYENLAIQTNVIHAAWKHGVQKLVFLGSSCIYPRMAPQPIREEHLLTGPLEPTNQWYAVAKIAGIKLCQAYRSQYGFNAISLMPTNLYGPGDNFHPQNSHVLPALMRKIHDAKERGAPMVAIWGSGTPRREFLHVEDLADAAVYLARQYSSSEILNVGTGNDIPISDLANLLAEIVGYDGVITNDLSKPDGAPRKLLDVTRLHQLGWRPTIGLRAGLKQTYSWFRENYANLRNQS